MAKTKNDEIYERGVRDGQTKGGFDHFVQNNTPKTNEDDEIYDKGYQYGASHKPDKTTSRESESISSHDDPRSSSGSDYSSSGGGGGGGGEGAGCGCVGSIVAFILFGLACKAFTTIFEPKETPRETQREQVIQEETAGDVTRRILDGINPWTGPIQENTYQPRHVGKISFNPHPPSNKRTIVSDNPANLGWVGFKGLELTYNIPITVNDLFWEYELQLQGILDELPSKTTAKDLELVIKIPDDLRKGPKERSLRKKEEKRFLWNLEVLIDKDENDNLSSKEVEEFYDDIQLELRTYLNDKGYLDGGGLLLSDKKEILQNNDQLGRELCERYIKKNLFQRPSTTGANYNGGSTGR